MERYAEGPAFIFLKDHKKNFKYNTKCFLINPSKSEMGIVSKTFLEEINNKLNKHLCYNQCRSTFTVIEWFGSVENEKNCKLIKFDIVEFYPSMSAELLEKSINFARSIMEIELKINMQENPYDGNAWAIKEENPLIDVTMRSYDGAEVCELV